MIKINHLQKSDLELFEKILNFYLEVLEIHSDRTELYQIYKSIAKVLAKDFKSKIDRLRHLEKLVWQLHYHQAKVLLSALICYKSSSIIATTEVENVELFFNHLNKQIKYSYEKAF